MFNFLNSTNFLELYSLISNTRFYDDRKKICKVNAALEYI